MAFREVEGTFHVLTADNRYHCVEDEVGSMILRCVEAGATMDEVVRAVETHFDPGEADVRRDVRSFLSELVRRRVLTRVRERVE